MPVSDIDQTKKQESDFMKQSDEIEPITITYREADEKTRESLLELFVEKDLIELFSQEHNDELERDELFEESAYLIVTSQQGSTSLLQRKLKLGYNRAGRIIDQLELAGIIGPFDGSKPREVKVATEFALEQYLKDLQGSFYTNGSGLNSRGEWDGSLGMSYGLKLFYQNNFDEIISRCEQKDLLEKQLQREEKDRLDKEKIKQSMLERERKKRLHKEALNELIEEGSIFNEIGKREFISQDVMDSVWNRDGGKCAKCGSNENLEFDHIIPFSKGGATTYRNIQLLCKKCNIEKSNKIG